jgi:tripartite motif-containing protein 9/67
MGTMREVDGVFAKTGITPGGKLIALIQTALVWDETFKGANIIVRNHNRTVTKRNDEEYETILGNLELSTGCHKWEIKIDNYVSDEDIFIGVAKKDMNLYIRPTETGKAWGFLCTRGRKFGPDGQFLDYSENTGTDDVIGVQIEFTNGHGALSFTRNG